MSAQQNEIFSPQNLTVLGVLLLIAIIIGEVVMPRPGAPRAAAKAEDTVDDIAMRLQPVVSLDKMRGGMGTMTAAAGAAADQSPEQLYQGACLACHNTGAAGAPKLGDAGAWSERLAKGIDALVSSAIGGIGAMPPRGGSQLSDEQIRDVVEYILAESK